jgi:protein phosphatase
MEINLPEFALVLLVGPSGCGKSTFAARHFRPTQVLSSDACRALVCDDENNQAATRDAFDLLHFIAEKRLASLHLTVIDATNLQSASRRPLLALAHQHHAPLAAIVFDLPEELCYERNRKRSGRQLKAEAVQRQYRQFKDIQTALRGEGIENIILFNRPEQVESARIMLHPLPNNRRSDPGPFDIIGDVHGCATELEELLEKLGYVYVTQPDRPAGMYARRYAHPEGRKAVFLGDLMDRGPRVLDAYQLVRSMLLSGSGLCVMGNHDHQLLRILLGQTIEVSAGMQATLKELNALPERLQTLFRQEMLGFFRALPDHYVFDHGKLVVAHAGIKKGMIGRESDSIRMFTLYGETTGEVDAYGLAVRANWAAQYHGPAIIVYGHTAVTRPEWLNKTIDIDTGCVYGGSLTALRYPELSLVSVQAKAVYRQAPRPAMQA